MDRSPRKAPLRSIWAEHVRLGLWAILPVVLTSLVVGCLNKAADKSDENQEKTEQTAPPPKPYLEGWDKPLFALVLTGETFGYLEPCGCSANQSGGLARRADLIKKLKEKGWSVVPLELGSTLKNPRRAQAQNKFNAIVSAYAQLGYQAFGTGLEELQLGPINLIQQSRPEELGFPFLSANVKFSGDLADLGTPVVSKLIEVDGKKIGVTSILGGENRARLIPQNIEGASALFQIEEAAKVLPKLLEDLKGQGAEYFVLLSNASMTESKELAQTVPGFDLVMSAGGTEDPDGKPIEIGKTMFVNIGHKGKRVGVVGFYPEGRKFELIELDQARFAADPSMRQIMVDYQDSLRDADIVGQELSLPHPKEADYVGADRCGTCHTKSYSKWKQTRHALATESLVKGRRGQEKDWIPRLHDPECLSCHVTGWNPQDVYPYRGGYISEEKTPKLRGQQCENCHGPGSKHVALEEARKAKGGAVTDEITSIRATMHIDLKHAKENLCVSCHDYENSPKFDFDKYWKEVVHPGRD